MEIINKIINEFLPGKKLSPWQHKLITWIFSEKSVTHLLEKNEAATGITWVESVIDTFELNIDINSDAYNKIPATGPVIVVSNHPTLADGISLIKTISKVRTDIKFIANHLLTIIFPQVKELTIGIHNMNGSMGRKEYKEMNDHLKNGGVLIICPSGRLASAGLTGLRESPWHAGFIQLAIKAKAAIVPIHIHGRNSIRYYITALIYRPLSNLTIMREALRQRGNRLRITVCKQIDLSKIKKSDNDYSDIAAKIQRHLFLSGNGKKGIVPELPPVAIPEKRSFLISELNECEILKRMSDGKIVYLYHYNGSSYSAVLREIGRLREISYRSIGAGTGALRDNDIYDRDYYHIILWDPNTLEIAGAYRVIYIDEQIKNKGFAGLYSYSLFNYQEGLIPNLESSIEIGRGFVQHQYQKTNAIDVLWKGIFCFIAKYPRCKNLLGVLSISQSYPTDAQKLIVSFYQKYFSEGNLLCSINGSYGFDCSSIDNIFSGDNFDADWKKLNEEKKKHGKDLPWPYKQAARWFQPGGSKIHAFVKDDHFNSIAALNTYELSKLKEIYIKHFVYSVDGNN